MLPCLTLLPFSVGSAVNFMQYNRPAASDFDEWETEYDNLGWGSKNLIPLVNKVRKSAISSNPVTKMNKSGRDIRN